MNGFEKNELEIFETEKFREMSITKREILNKSEFFENFVKEVSKIGSFVDRHGKSIWEFVDQYGPEYYYYEYEGEMYVQRINGRPFKVDRMLIKKYRDNTDIWIGFEGGDPLEYECTVEIEGYDKCYINGISGTFTNLGIEFPKRKGILLE